MLLETSDIGLVAEIARASSPFGNRVPSPPFKVKFHQSSSIASLQDFATQTRDLPKNLAWHIVQTVSAWHTKLLSSRANASLPRVLSLAGERFATLSDHLFDNRVTLGVA